jgi:hypothetical protein
MSTLPGPFSFRVDVWDNDPLDKYMGDVMQIKILDCHGVTFHLGGYGAPGEGMLTSGNIVIHRKK